MRKLTKHILISLILTFINLIAIILAYGICYYLKPDNQIIFQSVIAFVISTLMYFGLAYMINSMNLKEYKMVSVKDITFVLVLSLAWSPLLFYTSHYGTEGYLSTFNDIQYLWYFQFSVNLISLFGAKRFVFKETTEAK